MIFKFMSDEDRASCIRSAKKEAKMLIERGDVNELIIDLAGLIKENNLLLRDILSSIQCRNSV